MDTSVWIEHFRSGLPRLAEALLEGQVLLHPLVVGELACGNLRPRRETLEALRNLPRPPVASHDETLQLLEARRLWGRGLGWIDVQLLAAALLAAAPLWTLDRRLAAVARELDLA